MLNTRTRTGIAIGMLLAMSGAAASAGGGSSYHGVFHETDAGAADPLGYDIHGSAKMTVGAPGTTVKITVSGLDPTKEYPAHLHNGSCASGGGSHYQDDEEGAIEPPNELWLTNAGGTLVANPGGVAHGAGTATWQARTSSASQTNARSVVVHEPAGPRIACADLT